MDHVKISNSGESYSDIQASAGSDAAAESDGEFKRESEGSAMVPSNPATGTTPHADPTPPATDTTPHTDHTSANDTTPRTNPTPANDTTPNIDPTPPSVHMPVLRRSTRPRKAPDRYADKYY